MNETEVTSVTVNKKEGYVCLYFKTGSAQVLNDVQVNIAGEPLNENQLQTNTNHESVLREISLMPKVRGIGKLENDYNRIIDLVQVAIRSK